MNNTFASLGVPEDLTRSLAARGITEPFPIQVATVPDGLAGRDLCGKAPTGSGKTMAFGIPMVLRVKRAAPKRPKGLVLAPTRELALQVSEELKALAPDQRILAVYGGAGIEPQLKALRRGVDIVVACPGRLLDVIDRKACDLRDVSFVVVDEADRMADMGFLPDVRRLLDQTSDDRQTVLFSATLDGVVDSLVKEYQHDPAVHELEDEAAGDIAHHLWLVERPERAQIAAEIIERAGPTVVFSRTRHGADRIAKQLERAGVSAAAIHGSRSQAQRERALNAFHRGDVKALVATDVAARGIHVEGVMCVVHFDIPADHKDYVHRSGRTGRAGASGTVVAFVAGAQRKDANKLAHQAGIDAVISAPDVALVPEGHAQFSRTAARPSSRSARPTKTQRATRRATPDERYRTDAPSSRPNQGRSSRSGPSADRRGANGKPRTAPGDRSQPRGKSTDRRHAGGPATSGSQRSPKRAGRPDPAPSAATGPARDDSLDRKIVGSGKVRPSGASRRKARREALIAAGVDPATVSKPKRRR